MTLDVECVPVVYGQETWRCIGCDMADGGLRVYDGTIDCLTCETEYNDTPTVDCSIKMKFILRGPLPC